MLIFSVFTMSCNRTMSDELTEVFIPINIKGKVLEITPYKGGNTTLEIESNSFLGEHIGLDKKYREIVCVGDFFVKERNTNKCLIKRNDSIILLDCADREYLTSVLGSSATDSLEMWKPSYLNRWFTVDSTLSNDEVTDLNNLPFKLGQ